MPALPPRPPLLTALILWLGLVAPAELAAQRDYQLTSFSPTEISYLGSTPFVILGSGFNPGIQARIGGELVTTTRIDATRLEGLVPATDARNIGTTPDVTIDDPVSGRLVKAAAFRYVGPFRLLSVAIAGGGATLPAGVGGDIIVRGTGFTPLTSVLVGATRVEERSVQLVSAAELRCPAPGLGAGPHDVTVEDFEGPGRTTRVVSVLPDALVYAGDIAIASFEPAKVSYLGKDAFTLRGRGFSARTTVTLAGVRVPPGNLSSIRPTEITGTVPAYGGPDSNVARAVEVSDPIQGTAALERGITYSGPLEVIATELTGGRRALAAETGGRVTLRGHGFTRDSAVELVGGAGNPGVVADIRDPEHEDADTIAVDAPPLPAGSYHVRVSDRQTATSPLIAFTLREALVYESSSEPAAIRAVSPRHVSTLGTTRISITGVNFRAGLRLSARFADGSVKPLAYERLDATRLAAIAPAPPRTGAAVADLILQDGVTVTLEHAFAYGDPWIPGPEEVEATFVRGQAEIAWVNPMAYQEIEVFREGQLIATLPGRATSFRDPQSLDADAAEYTLVGHLNASEQGIANFSVGRWSCDQPPLSGTADRGQTDFRLRGGHESHEESLAGGGGGSRGLPSCHNLFQASPAMIDQVTGLPFTLADPHRFAFLPNELITGFTLLEEATKLRLEIHCGRVLSGPDLSLRVLIRSVTEGVNRVVELIAPDPPVSAQHRWIDFTYNTELPQDGLRAYSSPPGAVGQDAPLPAADYQVLLYATGGTTGGVHYVVSSDFSTDQILVPGVGCPPYPLVRVTDTTGRNSNPEVHGVLVHKDTQLLDPGVDENGDLLYPLIATLEADATDPDGDTILKYIWRFQDGNRLDVVESASNTLCRRFPDYGVYRVTVTAVDYRCGRGARTLDIQVEPPRICLAGNLTNYTFPSPRPNDIYFVPNLPGGIDHWNGTAPQRFQLFVVDPGACSRDGGTAKTKKLQVGLFRLAGGLRFPISYAGGIDGEAKLQAELLTLEDTGARFWAAEFEDLGGLEDTASSFVHLMARGSPTTSANVDDYGEWALVQSYKPEAPHPIVPGSSALHVRRKPAFFDNPGATTAGEYDPQARSYRFELKLGETWQTGASIPPSPPLPLNLADGAVLPSFLNSWEELRQTSVVTLKQGIWSLESHRLGADGHFLNKALESDREFVKAPTGNGAGIVPGGIPCLPQLSQIGKDIDFCCKLTVLDTSFYTNLLTAAFPVVVGPVNLSVFTSIALGAAIDVELQAELHGSGSSPLSLTADVRGLVDVDAFLPAFAHVTMFTGVQDIDAHISISPNFFLDVPIRAHMDSSTTNGPDLDYALNLSVTDLSLDVTACVLCAWCLVPVLCYWDDFPLLPGNQSSGDLWSKNKGLIDDGTLPLTLPGCPEGDGAGAADRGSPGIGGGQAEVPISGASKQLSVATSPDGSLQLGIARFIYPSGQVLAYFYRESGSEWQIPVEFGFPINSPGTGHNPRVVFTSNDTVLVAWTQNFGKDDPELQGLPPPTGPNLPPEIYSRVLSNNEIVCRAGTLYHDPESETPDLLLVRWGNTVRVSGDLSFDDLHADGMVDLVPLEGQSAALAAWVRYDSDEIVQPLDPENPGSRPIIALDQTAIHARRIAVTPGQGFNPPVAATQGDRVSVSGSDGTINIDPDLTVAGDGTIGIVWLHDAEHRDLVTSNRSRNILFSRLAGGAWTAPEPILTPADAAVIPGILRPSLALADASYGMVAFTGLPSDAAESDAGLGNTRMVYTVKRLASQWQSPPVLIFKECDTPVFASAVEIFKKPAIPIAIDKNPLPDFTIFVREFGPLGTRDGAGNVLAAGFNPETQAWSPPTNLTPDNRSHTGFTAALTPQGELALITDAAQLANVGESLAGGGGGGAPAGSTLQEGIVFRTMEIAADPLITSCRIEDANAGPGATVGVTVGVGNHGLAGTPVDDAGASTLGVEVLFRDAAGRTSSLGRALAPLLLPGSEALVAFDIEIPRSPGRLIARVDNVPGESDPANNQRGCALGAQRPESLACEVVRDPDEPDTIAVVLTWTQQGLYDYIRVYRDGCMLTELPGSETSFVDRGLRTLRGSRLDGTHTYSVRGVAGNSISERVECEVDGDSAPPPPPVESFRRGDADGNGTIEITDPLFTFGYLFLGGREPACPDAADSDDNGALEITDGVRVLGWLFLGGVPPARPGPEACGEDPTPDGLDRCGPECR